MSNKPRSVLCRFFGGLIFGVTFGAIVSIASDHGISMMQGAIVGGIFGGCIAATFEADFGQLMRALTARNESTFADRTSDRVMRGCQTTRDALFFIGVPLVTLGSALGSIVIGLVAIAIDGRELGISVMLSYLRSAALLTGIYVQTVALASVATGTIFLIVRLYLRLLGKKAYIIKGAEDDVAHP